MTPPKATRTAMLWRIVWTLVVVAFLVSTVPTVIPGFHGQFLQLGQPYHSTDLYLQSITELPNCSTRFRELVRKTPREKSILIVVPRGSARGSLVGMVFSYLAWPHPTRIMTVSSDDCGPELARVTPNSLAAVTFCDVSPPSWLHAGVSLGNNNSFVLLERKVAAK